jgi:DNA-directed RNA polymerase specialized sigma24 family protein
MTDVDDLTDRVDVIESNTTLSQRQAFVFVAMYEIGATETHVANALGVAVGTVRSHKGRVDDKIAEARTLVEAADEADG